jgi:hypothetical protein
VADTALAGPCVLDVQWLGYWGEQPTGIACGEPSFATVSLACPHEHADTARICPGCAVDVQKAHGMLTCKRCWDAPGRRHKCMMLVVIDWDSGEKTIAQEAGDA